jgi:hypothetical protein
MGMVSKEKKYIAMRVIPHSMEPKRKVAVGELIPTIFTSTLEKEVVSPAQLLQSSLDYWF